VYFTSNYCGFYFSGKTIQTVSFLHQLRYTSCTKISGPFLIIAPLSLVDQWYSEISTWSPDMNCILLHGNSAARDVIYANEFYYQEPFVSKSDAKTLKNANVHKFHILLTTFEMAVKEISKISRIHWKLMVIDEAHKLKNAQARLFTTLGQIPRDHCLLLTGTPLQNKTEVSAYGISALEIFLWY
jgi:SNF2 family DNA or RNA helicase